MRRTAVYIILILFFVVAGVAYWYSNRTLVVERAASASLQLPQATRSPRSMRSIAMRD